jgi:prepilin-type N-terminal cleavage/methylation domain-containing protein
MSTRRRHGFTSIELLLVIVISSILITLCLPAVQKARESARQNQCRSHLRQMGIALQSYESARGFLPSSPSALLQPRPSLLMSYPASRLRRPAPEPDNAD